MNQFNESEPTARLQIGDEELLMTRENGTLFTFIGDIACYSHVFVEDDVEAETNIGTYIFSHNPAYDILADFMMENGFTLHLNLREVAHCDQDAYNRGITQQLDDLDHVPDDWLEP